MKIQYLLLLPVLCFAKPATYSNPSNMYGREFFAGQVTFARTMAGCDSECAQLAEAESTGPRVNPNFRDYHQYFSVDGISHDILGRDMPMSMTEQLTTHLVFDRK